MTLGAGSPRRVVIAGAGQAGAAAAAELRRLGFDGRLTIVGDEPELPYQRPPLSKGYLRGEQPASELAVAEATELAAGGVEIRPGTIASGLDAGRRELVLAGGERLPYDRLLVATGSRNRPVPFPGAALAGVHQLRTRQEAEAIRREAAGAERAVVVGMGFIGCEVAASLRQLGLRVTALDRSPAPLQRVLGPAAGTVLAAIHRDHGVELLSGDEVAALEGGTRVERVRTRAGRRLECDLVVAGLGVDPEAGLLRSAGAGMGRGVLVDERCRTSIPDVFAAGDVTDHSHPLFGRTHIEHFNNAVHQGRAAARAMLGDPAPYAYLHSFWSDQYEHTIEYLGHAATWDATALRGSLAERRFLLFYLREGRLRAVMGLDRGGDPELPGDEGELKVCAELIRAGARPDVDRLTDETVDLGRLAKA